MPAALPPMRPEPIRRSRMPKRSSSVRYAVGQPVELRVVADHHPRELLLERRDLGRLSRRRPDPLSRYCISRRYTLSHGAIDVRLSPGAGACAPTPKTAAASPLWKTGDQLGARHDVGQEHLRRVAVPDLERVDVHAAPRRGRRRSAAGSCRGSARRRCGVLAAGQREVGHRVQLEQERAGDLEEVGQQLVGGPLDDERGEVVEDVEDLPARAPR